MAAMITIGSIYVSGVDVQTVHAAESVQTFVVAGKSGDDIQNCLYEARYYGGGIVKVPAGTYELGTEPLHIYSNTTLSLDDKAVIKRASGKSSIMLMNGDWSDSEGGYSRNNNIIIEGGTWDGSNGSNSAEGNNNLYFGHATGIVVRDTVLKNCYGEHLLELTGVKGATVSNVVFDGYIGENSDENTYKEALQIDYISEATSGAFAPYDDTACDSVTISNCTFKNYSCGIGSHSFKGGVYHKNIEIENNTFQNISNIAIDAQNYSSAKINNNSCDKSVTFAVVGNSDVTANNNNCGITSKYGFYIEKAATVDIFGGNIKGAKKSGIYVENKSNVAVDSVNINECVENGIFSKESTIKAIDNNISSITYNGIYIQNPVGAADISGNTIFKTGYAGVRIDDGINNTAVKSNNIKNSETYGIVAFGVNNSVIQDNTVDSCKDYGIYIREASSLSRSKIAKINNNSVKNAPSGIVVRNTDNAIVSGNVISDVDNYGLFINENCTKTTVTNNKYTGDFGVYDKTTINNSNNTINAELKNINGQWKYMNGNKVLASYTGLTYYNGSWWYIDKGYLRFNYTGLCKYNGSWWYIRNSKVDFNSTTLVKYNGSWWYVHGGKVDFSSNTLVKYNGSWWYVHGGKVDFSSTTLVKYNGLWWYVHGGKVDFSSRTLVKYNGSWWYIHGGCVDFSSKTLVYYNGTWWYVYGGKVNFGSKTLVYYNGTWWYVHGGCVDFKYTGYVVYNGTRYHVTNGKL